MAEQEPVPDSADELAEGLDDMSELDDDESRGPSLLSVLWYYHPIVFLSLSLMLAAMAYIVKPKKVSFEPKQAVELYAGGLKALRLVMDADAALSPVALEAQIRSARTDFEILFRHRFSELSDHPEFINPYLLMADASRLYAEHIPLRRQERYEEAILAYRKGLQWEQERRRPAEARQYYEANFGALREGRVPPPAELAVRKQRRERYLRYQMAVSAVEAARPNHALKELSGLDREFRQEELERQRRRMDEAAGATAASGAAQVETYLPGPFELVPEDRIRLYYHLARAHEQLRQPEEAEREYQLFLLQAPRSKERFLALMRLGAMYLERGQSLLSAAVRHEATADTARTAQRYFQMAAGKYSLVVEASAPEEILREAYFRGGMAYLGMAEGTEVGRETWWDAMGDRGSALRTQLKAFAGRELPERTRGVPLALGHLLVGAGTDVPSPVGTTVQGSLGAILALAAAQRQTRRAQRDGLLGRAESFLNGASSGTQGRFTAAARVMIARTLLARDQRGRARELFRHTQRTYPDAEIQAACLWGEARAYLADGDLEKAKTRYIGGMEKESSSRLRDKDISWVELCTVLTRKGTSKTLGPSRRLWELLSSETRSMAQAVARTRRIDKDQKATMLLAINRVLRRKDFYAAREFASVKLTPEVTWLLQRDRESLLESEREWLNRLLLEAAFPRIVLAGAKGVYFAGLPDAAALPKGLLVPRDEIIADLQELVRGLLRRADRADAEIRQSERRGTGAGARAILSPLVRQTYVRRRRSLEDAAEVNEALLARYAPTRSDVLMETAEIYERLAQVVASRPFLQAELGRQLGAKAARTYLRVARAAPGTPREEEALWEAGRGFYRARQFERATEALQEYVDKYKASDRAGMAQNWLGRAHRNLGELRQAAGIYRDNADRRTTEGRKALYYLGWVYLQLEKRLGDEGTEQDLIGDPSAPLPQRTDGLLRIDNALQAFNHVRQLEDIAPDSRPWRWATFDLGATWLRIAERERQREWAARQQGQKPQIDRWVGLYRDHALPVLREALDRYLLKRHDGDLVGVDPLQQPEDYGEVVCARFVAEYHLARVRMVLAKALREPRYALEAREPLAHLVDPKVYPDVMFDSGNPKPLYLAIVEAHQADGNSSPVRTAAYERHPLLGAVEGPVYYPEYLKHLRRNAYFLLGQNYIEEGERLVAEAPQRAQEAYRAAYGVYQAAHDRLPPDDAPLVMYLQAECLKRMGRKEEAARRYRLALNTARNLKAAQSDALRFIGPGFWAQLASDRLKDQDQGF